MLLDNIVQDPKIMVGNPTVRGTRVTLSMIVRQLSEGESAQKLLERYPYLKAEGITEALQYAAST